MSLRSILALFMSYLFLMMVMSCSFSAKATRRLFEASRLKTYDMVVVPGVPFVDGKWSRTMKGRVYWSKYLYDQGIAKNIMYSGSSVYSPYYEGEIMALYAIAIGIPKEHVFSETMAEHSTENIYYSYKKARKLGFTQIALASDPFQTKSLRKFTRKKVNADVALIPMVIDTMKKLEPSMVDPDIAFEKAFNKNFVSIRKKQSYWRRLMGTLGKNIDKSAYDSLAPGSR